MGDIIMEFEDSLDLNKSEVIAVTDQGSTNVNLTLAESQALALAAITGTVYDTQLLTGTPVSDATVLVYNAAGNVVGFGKTNILGVYTITGLTNATSYTAVAVKDGYTATAPNAFTATILSITVMNFAIVPNTNFTLNTVYGIVEDSSNTALSGATVVLENSETNEIVSITETIDDGEYVLYNVPEGSYILRTIKDGYYSVVSNTIELTTSENHPSNVTMEAVTDVNSGVISGIIKNSQDQVVANVFVALYTLASGNVPETLIDYTYTNANGRYAFGNVTPGSYIVKAKLSD